MRLREKQRLNDLIAKRVIGWFKRGAYWCMENDDPCGEPYKLTRFVCDPIYAHADNMQYFDPATKIEHAWMVLEVLQAKDDANFIRFWVEIRRAALFSLRGRDAAKVISSTAIKYCK